MAPKHPNAYASKFSKGDEIAMTGTVTIVHDEAYGRRQVTVRLRGFDYPLTVSDEHVDLVAKAKRPKSGRRKSLVDLAD
jgi:hypothetical protein